MFALLPFLAPLLARLGEVRASQENGERLLRRGELVGVFPGGREGRRQAVPQRYKLARFGRGGFVRLALRTQAPDRALRGGRRRGDPSRCWRGPTGWGGRWACRTSRSRRRFPWLGPLGVVPLPTQLVDRLRRADRASAYGPEAADDPILVNRLSEQVRSTIQQHDRRRLARRRSVWFG